MKKTKVEYNVNIRKVSGHVVGGVIIQLLSNLTLFVLTLVLINQIGDESNGLFQSINSIFGYLGLAEIGFNTVYQQSLYKDFSHKDYDQIVGKLKGMRKLFNKIIYGYTAFAIGLIVIYPLVVSSSFSYEQFMMLIILFVIRKYSKYTYANAYEIAGIVDEKTFAFKLVEGIYSFISTGLIVAIVMFFDLETYDKLFVVVLILTIKAFVLDLSKRMLCRKWMPWLRFKNVKPIPISLKNVWFQTMGSIGQLLTWSTDTVTISIMLGLVKNSIYSVYILISSAIRGMSGILTNILEIVVGKKNSVSKIDGESFKLINFGIFYAAAFVMICFIMVAPAFITLFFDAQYFDNLYVVLFAVVTGIAIISGPALMYVRSNGRFKFIGWLFLLEGLFNIALSILLIILTDDISGAIIATIITSSITFIIVFAYFVKNLIEENKASVTISWLKTLFAIMLPVAAVSIFNNEFQSYFDWNSITDLIKILIISPIIAGAGLFIISLIVEPRVAKSFYSNFPILNKIFKK